MKSTIFMAYHKNAEIIKSTCLTPIHVGKNISNISLDMLGDNTGDNISEKNIHYAELTAIYWAWKNCFSDNIGLFHYRRLLDLNDKSLFADDTYYELPINKNIKSEKIINSLCITDENINNLLKKYDLIVRRRETISTWSNWTIYDHYKNSHIIEHLDYALFLIKNLFPDYYEISKKICDGDISFFGNTFIMPQNIFKEYCNFIFTILNIVYNKENIYKQQFQEGNPQARFLGFLGERLTSFYIFKKLNDGFKVKECPAVIITPNKNTRWYECDTYDKKTYNNPKKINTHQHNDTKDIIVTVIICAYNVENYIERAVTSVQKQTLQNIEIVIVNDGSTDNTLYLLNKIANNDFRIIIITQQNKGLGFARNIGLAKATGKYVHFMDADDFMEEDFLESLILTGEQHSAEIVVSTHNAVNENGEFLYSGKLLSTLRTDITHNVDNTPDILLTPCHVWDKIFLRTFLGEDPFLIPFAEDIPFFWNFFPRAKKIAIFRQPKYNYMINSKSVQAQSGYIDELQKSINLTQNIIKERNKIVKQYFELFKAPLLCHIIHRSRFTIFNDDLYCQKIYSFFKTISNSIVIDDELSNKQSFYTFDTNFFLNLLHSIDYNDWKKKIFSYFSFDNIKEIPSNIKNTNSIVALYSLYRQMQYIKKKGIFDYNYYLQQFPELKTCKIDPLYHFFFINSSKQKKPIEWFDPQKYLDINPDIYYSFLNPFYHYIKYGILEGRKLS